MSNSYRIEISSTVTVIDNWHGFIGWLVVGQFISSLKWSKVIYSLKMIIAVSIFNSCAVFPLIQGSFNEFKDFFGRRPNFSSVWFRHTRSRQTYDTWFHNIGPPSIETTKSPTGSGHRPVKLQIIESPLPKGFDWGNLKSLTGVP